MDCVRKQPCKVSDLPTALLRCVCKHLNSLEVYRFARINRRMNNRLDGEWFYDYSSPSPHNGALLAAAQHNHLRTVERAIQKGADANVKDQVAKYTALITASEEGHVDIVLYLLKCPAIDVNVATPNGMTALHYAAQNGHKAIVQMLLGCPVLRADLRDLTDATPLILAARHGHLAVVSLLLERGDAGLNATCRNVDITFDGHTALFWAALGAHVKTVSALLAASRTPIAERSLSILRSERSFSILSLGCSEQDLNEIERMVVNHQVSISHERKATEP